MKVYITPEEYEIAKRNGVNSKNLYNRIKLLGMSKEEAINRPARKKMKNGELEKWSKLAEKNGISYGTFCKRVYTSKWSLEEAATTPILSNKEVWKRSKSKGENL